MPIHKAHTSNVHDDYQTQREFERVAKRGSNIEKILNALNDIFNLSGGGKPNDTLPKLAKSIWALTTEHNNNIIVRKVDQALRWIDGKPKDKSHEGVILFQLTKNTLEESLRTIPDAERTIIRAKCYTYIWDILDAIHPIRSIHRDELTLEQELYLDLINDAYTDSLLTGQEGDEYWYYGTKAYEDYPDINRDANKKGWFKLQDAIEHFKGYIAIDVDWTDVTPGGVIVGDIPALSIVQTVMIEVKGDWDSYVMVSVGDADNHNRLMLPQENDLDEVNRFHAYPDYKYLAKTQVKLYFNYSQALTQGTLRCIIYYH